jgi:hypothetical protein
MNSPITNDKTVTHVENTVLAAFITIPSYEDRFASQRLGLQFLQVFLTARSASEAPLIPVVGAVEKDSQTGRRLRKFRDLLGVQPVPGKPRSRRECLINIGGAAV